jgi:hypothetical protein
MYVERNHALGFARRTKVNLEYLEEAQYEGANVHIVTNLANSLLGLVVFVWERTVVDDLKKHKMSDLYATGWPEIKMIKGTTATLFDFVRHLRNAAGHGLLEFSGDDADPEKVIIKIKDREKRGKPSYWVAQLTASDLRRFCFKFIELVERKTS